MFLKIAYGSAPIIGVRAPLRPVQARWNRRANSPLCFKFNTEVESSFKKVTHRSDVPRLSHSDCDTVHLVQLVRQAQRSPGTWGR